MASGILSRKTTATPSQKGTYGRLNGCASLIFKATQEELRGVLGQMLFRRRSDARSPPGRSLGGESARLIFCKPDAAKAERPGPRRAHLNLSLDLESINALNIALQKYPGTLQIVTHDHDRYRKKSRRGIQALQRRARRGFPRDPYDDHSGLRWRKLPNAPLIPATNRNFGSSSNFMCGIDLSVAAMLPIHVLKLGLNGWMF